MHFTYGPPKPDGLEQGDILKRTPELMAVIEQVHPHYGKDSYLYFQILTQSCDLVRRKNGCKTRYISLAAVRPFSLVVQRVVEKLQNKLDFKGRILCSTEYRDLLKDVFNKLFNNNDTNHFFLNAAPEFGLNEDCCTFLHLSIAIRSSEHYDVCMGAKILELQDSFRAKLGWSVGNLYSRVGTEDYVPGAIHDTTTYDSFVKDRMEQYVGWIEKTDFTEFKKLAAAGQTIEEVMETVTSARDRKRVSKLNQLTNALVKALKLEGEQVDILRNTLNQDPIVQRALKS